MNDPESTSVAVSSPERKPRDSVVWRWLGRAFRLLLLAAIIVPSGYISYHWMMNPPTTQRRPPQPHAVLVEAVPIHEGMEQITVRAMGTVTPSKSIQIAAQVAGRIVEVHPNFERGGRFAKGDKILQIERDDYELAVRQQEGNLTKAEADLQLERGQQAVARREYELLGEDVNAEEEQLLLRQPQRATKEATVAITQSALDKAHLDLERTAIYAPFNALMMARPVNLGSHVTVGAPVATIASADACWVEVTIPVNEMQWIAVPGINGDSGATVHIFHEAAWGPGAYREGIVAWLLHDLEPQGRMARLLVRVEDPLDLRTPENERKPLLFGAFVRADILGREAPGALRIPRTALRDGNKVWVMLPDKTLDIRIAQVLWGDNENVLISGGLSDGEMLVTSDLASPVQGMALRTADDAVEGAGSGRRRGGEGAP